MIQRIKATPFLLLICILFTFSNCASIKKETQSKIELIAPTFPSDPLYKITGEKASISEFMNNKKSSLIILVNPSCEDCIKKMKFIRKNLMNYKKENIILLANKDKVEDFKALLAANQLVSGPSLQFALATEEMSVSLRVPTVPSLYKYEKSEGVYYFEHGTSIDKAFEQF